MFQSAKSIKKNDQKIYGLPLLSDGKVYILVHRTNNDR